MKTYPSNDGNAAFVSLDRGEDLLEGLNQAVAQLGFQAATIRTLDDLQKMAPLLARPDGPMFLDCKLNAAVAAPFMSEIHEFETRQH